MTFQAFPNLALAHLQSRFIYYAATLEPMLQPFSLLQGSSVSLLTPPCLCPGSTLPRMPNSSSVCLKECLLTATTKKQPNKQKRMPLTSPSSLHCQVLCEASPYTLNPRQRLFPPPLPLLLYIFLLQYSPHCTATNLFTRQLPNGL